MARPETKSVSDLTGTIAISDRQSASEDNVRTAILAAGATDVQLSGDQTKALNRLISGEVPCGQVTILNRQELEWRSCECYAVSKQEFDRLLGAPTGPHARMTAPYPPLSFRTERHLIGPNHRSGSAEFDWVGGCQLAGRCRRWVQAV
jgi:hypothetical protein